MKRIVLHHTGVQTSHEQYASVVSYHKAKWGKGMMYHYLIDTSGEVKAGVPEDEIGWHAGKWWWNVISFGICVSGDLRYHSPSGRQVRSLAVLVTDLQKRYGIPNSNIYHHGEIKTTECPGTNLRGLIAEEHQTLLRQRLYAVDNALKFPQSPRREKLLHRLLIRLKRILNMI